MSFTFVQSDDGAVTGFGGGLFAITWPSAITAGNLLIVSAVWEGSTGSGNAGVFEDSGKTKPFTMLTRTDAAGGDLHVQIGYLMSATETDNAIYIQYPTSYVEKPTPAMAFSWTGTTVLDQTNLTATGSGTSYTSNNITTTGSVELVLGFVSSYSDGLTFSLQKIGGTTATNIQSSSGGRSTLFARQTTGTINATATGTVSDIWIAQIISFKEDAGGGPSAFPAHYYNAMMEA